jgi:iron(III) transport system permease protein
MISISLQKSYGLGFKLSNITFQNYIDVVSNPSVYKAILNSINLAIITCIICILIGTLVAYLKIRKNNKAMDIIEKSASFTYAIPGIVLALAMIFHWVEPVPGFRPGVYGTINILIIAYVTRYLIIQIKGSSIAILMVEPSLEEAALACGSSRIRMWCKVIIPLLVKPVLSSTFIVFMSSMTELTLSSILSAAGTKTIGLTVFNFQQSGDYILSSTMSACIMSLAFGGYFVCFIINKYKGSGKNNVIKNSKYQS